MGSVTRFLPILVVCAISGCASAPPPPPPGGASLAGDPCAVSPEGPADAGRIVFGLTESVIPDHAPDPWNEAERIVFRNLYETLVTCDCEGRPVAALATWWYPSEGARDWTFVLREDARFWNGERLTAYDVAAAWEDAAAAARAAWPDPSPWTGVNEIEARADGPDRITVRLQYPDPVFPIRLGLPAFAVALRSGAGDWPIGSGPFRPLPGGDSYSGDLVCVPSARGETEEAALSHVVFRIAPGADPRDLLAAGVDLVIVRERAALDYLAGSFDFGLAPLPPDRLHLLVSRFVAGGNRADPFRPSLSPAEDAPYQLSREEIARDVMTSDAYPADGFAFSDDSADSCLWYPGPRDLNAGRPVIEGLRIAYRSGDPDARGIAERIAALAGSRRPPWSDHFATYAQGAASGGSDLIVSTGLSDDAYDESLRRGGELGYVVTIDRGAAVSCRALDELVGAAPWLTDPAADNQSVPWPARAAGARLLGIRWVVPLVTSRPHLASRREIVGVRIDAAGTPLFRDAGWFAQEEPGS